MVVYSSNCHLIRVVQAAGQWRHRKLLRRINQPKDHQLVELGEYTYVKKCKNQRMKLSSLSEV